MIEIESAAVITTDWSRWIRRNNPGGQCLSLAQCEPPSSMCSSSTQAGNFRSATPSSSLLGIGSLQHVAHSFRSIVHWEGIALSASTRPQVVSSVSSLAKEITTRVRKVASNMQNWKPYLQPFVLYLCSYSNKQQRGWYSRYQTSTEDDILHNNYTYCIYFIPSRWHWMPERGASSQKNMSHGDGLGDDQRFDDYRKG